MNPRQLPSPRHGPQDTLLRLLDDLEAALPDVLPQITLQEAPTLIGRLEGLKAILMGHLLFCSKDSRKQTETGDRLLTAEETASKLGLKKDYLYKNADQFPFTIRIGSLMRFSEQGIEKFIRQRMGRK
jgi:predicted DNA-binding transcriptional regulator AlpA